MHIKESVSISKPIEHMILIQLFITTLYAEKLVGTENFVLVSYFLFLFISIVQFCFSSSTQSS